MDGTNSTTCKKEERTLSNTNNGMKDFIENLREKARIAENDGVIVVSERLYRNADQLEELTRRL